MNSYEEILKRADLSSISAFLMYGEAGEKPETTNYGERIKKLSEEVHFLLTENCPEESLREKIADKILEYVCESNDVYMEIGLRCGFKLAMQVNEKLGQGNGK